MKILITFVLVASIQIVTSDVTTSSSQTLTTNKTATKPQNIKEPNRPSTTPLRSSTTVKRNVGGVSSQTSKITTSSPKPTAPTPTNKSTYKNGATSKPTAPTPVTTTASTKGTTKKSVQAATTTIKSSVNTTSSAAGSTSTKVANTTVAASTTKSSNSAATSSKPANTTLTSNITTTTKPSNVTTTKNSNSTTVTPSSNSTTVTPVKNTVKTTTVETTAEETTEEATTEENSGETTEESSEESTEGETTEEGSEGETTEEGSSEETTEEGSEEETTEENSEETTEEEETTEAPPTTLKYPNNCICVPEGTCSVLGGNSTSTSNSTEDGAGQLDPRIVNPAQGTNQTTGTNSSIATVASTGVPIIAESQTNCNFWNPALDLCCPANGYQCGTVFPPMPGSPSMPGRSQFGQFPWQGMIFTTNDVYVGTGVLIDQQNFLTVAYRVLRFPNAQFKVRMGDWDTSSENEPLPYKEYTVKMTYVHENYTASNLKNNIAICRLEKMVPLGRYPTIATACLSMTDITGLRCFVSGWGRNDFTYGSNQAVQRFVDLPIVNRTQCEATLRMTRLGKNFKLDPGFMCAGGEPGKDACTGDGGAPLVCQVVSQWYVVGLVNWGIGCGTNIPGVYTDVNYYLPWIQSNANM